RAPRRERRRYSRSRCGRLDRGARASARRSRPPCEDRWTRPRGSRRPSRRGEGDARPRGAIPAAGGHAMTAEHSGARLMQGWERGFSPPAAAVLGTLAGGYRRFLGAREWLYEQGVLRSRGLGPPVVAIGNLTVGGTGKTPAVEMAVQTLLELGHRPVVVSRGYRRQSRGVQIVAD